MKLRIAVYVFLFLALLGAVAAHEIYVLSSGAVQTDMATQGINVFSVLNNPHLLQMFLTSALLVIIGIILLSYIIHTKLSQHIDERFEKMRKYAHLVIRVGLGLSLMWGALQNAIFGPELPLSGIFWPTLLFVVGLLLIIGAFTRIAAFIALIAFATLVVSHGIYLLNYLFYLAEILVLLLERGELFSVDNWIQWPSHIFHHKLPAFIAELEKLGQEYSFPIIRVCFGLGLLYAAISVKILHPALSLDVVNTFGILPAFTALFVVLCAAVIEILLALLVTFGILLRITLSVLFFFFVASALYFGEAIWPHIILLALCLGLFLHGKDQWCFEDKVYSLFWSWTKRFRKDKGLLTPQ